MCDIWCECARGEGGGRTFACVDVVDLGTLAEIDLVLDDGGLLLQVGVEHGELDGVDLDVPGVGERGAEDVDLLVAAALADLDVDVERAAHGGWFGVSEGQRDGTMQ